MIERWDDQMMQHTRASETGFHHSDQSRVQNSAELEIGYHEFAWGGNSSGDSLTPDLHLHQITVPTMWVYLKHHSKGSSYLRYSAFHYLSVQQCVSS